MCLAIDLLYLPTYFFTEHQQLWHRSSYDLSSSIKLPRMCPCSCSWLEYLIMWKQDGKIDRFGNWLFAAISPAAICMWGTHESKLYGAFQLQSFKARHPCDCVPALSYSTGPAHSTAPSCPGLEGLTSPFVRPAVHCLLLKNP